VGLLLMAVGHAAAQAASEEAKPEKGAPAALLAEARELFARLPEKMPDSENDTAARIELGRKLYFETALSSNRTQSCNTCHRLDEKLGGVDNLPTSKGAEGQLGTRNAPTTLNAGLHVAQFWDGRAADLAAQAKGPVLNPVEMTMSSEEEVLAARGVRLPRGVPGGFSGIRDTTQLRQLRGSGGRLRADAPHPGSVR
jgi:cytochrome c peroxidase